MTTTRGCFHVHTVNENEWGDEISLYPVTNEHSDAIPSAERYHEYTPSGNIRIMITNPNLRGSFEPGQFYYVDFTQIEA